jgi:hypothetical protein
MRKPKKALLILSLTDILSGCVFGGLSQPMIHRTGFASPRAADCSIKVFRTQLGIASFLFDQLGSASVRYGDESGLPPAIDALRRAGCALGADFASITQHVWSRGGWLLFHLYKLKPGLEGEMTKKVPERPTTIAPGARTI